MSLVQKFPRLFQEHQKKNSKTKRYETMEREKNDKSMRNKNPKHKFTISDLLAKESLPKIERIETIHYSLEKNCKTITEKKKPKLIKREKKLSNIQMCQENMMMFDLLRLGKKKNASENFQEKDQKQQKKSQRVQTSKNQLSIESMTHQENQHIQSYQFQNLKINTDRQQIGKKPVIFKTKLMKKKYKDLSIREMICDDGDSNVDGSVQKTIKRMRAVTEIKIQYNDSIGDCW